MHAVGGLVGNICTALFASDQIAHLDGVSVINGGWINHNWLQLPIQLADSFTGGLYSFAGTCVILFVMNLVPGLHLRAEEGSEVLGMDDAEIGEFAYDYVELRREVLLLGEDGVELGVGGGGGGVDTGSLFSAGEQQALYRSSPVGREKEGGIPMVDYRVYGVGQAS